MSAAKHFNKLTPAELERLALLSEEMGEAQQVIGKIIRHGYESVDPTEVCDEGHRPLTNRETLEKEMGDVEAALDMMMVDLHGPAIRNRTAEKLRSVRQWLHHQEPAI